MGQWGIGLPAYQLVFRNGIMLKGGAEGRPDGL